jgi:hypothetical protein
MLVNRETLIFRYNEISNASCQIDRETESVSAKLREKYSCIRTDTKLYLQL